MKKASQKLIEALSEVENTCRNEISNIASGLGMRLYAGDPEYQLTTFKEKMIIEAFDIKENIVHTDTGEKFHITELNLSDQCEILSILENAHDQQYKEGIEALLISERPKIIIEVDGGTISHISCTEALDIIVIDHDNITEEEKYIRKYVPDAVCEDLKLIYAGDNTRMEEIYSTLKALKF